MRPERDAPWTVVTGAAGGIGRAVVVTLLDEGRRVLALDRDLSGLADVEHANLEKRSLDVTDRAALNAAIDDAGERGGVTGLVCCAAIFPAAPILEMTEDDWDAVFAVNVEGTLLACQSALAHMRRAGKGAIVLFASTLARTGGLHAAHYAASKGAVLGFARSLALDVAAAGVRVNVVSPGLTDTAQPRGNMSEEAMFARASHVPLGRIGEPEDSAAAVSFLLSDDSSFITGQDLRVTGGAALF